MVPAGFVDQLLKLVDLGVCKGSTIAAWLNLILPKTCYNKAIIFNRMGFYLKIQESELWSNKKKGEAVQYKAKGL